MPCDSVIRNQVSFTAGTDPDMMKGALEDAGYFVNVTSAGIYFNHRENYRMGGTFNHGVFTVTQGTDTDAIKRAYSVRTVKQTAAKMGWKVRQDTKNPLRLQISRRS